MYCTYQYTFLFYYIETKAERRKTESWKEVAKKCKWLVGTHDVANGNDFNDYGNTYHYALKRYDE